MSLMARILKYELRDVVRGRAVILYALFLLLASELLLRFSGDTSKALLSLSNVVLLIVPLISLILGTMFVYNAREFNELLLSQPVGRRQLFGGLYLGLALPLVAAQAAGTGLPLLIHGTDTAQQTATALMLLVAGTFLTCIFTAVAFVIALRSEDRVRGMGLALLTWLFLAVVWDALVLAGANAFHAWPLERPLLILMLLNPVDLARVALMLNFDVSALMGYTGAVFRDFFGGPGLLVAMGALTLWAALPLFAGMRLFARRDF